MRILIATTDSRDQCGNISKALKGKQHATQISIPSYAIIPEEWWNRELFF